jgi:hypothetical protein
MAELQRAAEPFRFSSRLNLRELTGLKAKNLCELVSAIKTVPGSVIYHHTHHFLQQHQYLVPEPPNDFAYWVEVALGYKDLAEDLASINTCEYKSIRALRERIVAEIEDYLARVPASRDANEGEEFHFIKSISFVFPTAYAAYDLKEFREIVSSITIEAIYFHMFESRLRLERGVNDFSNWIRDELAGLELAGRIEQLDPYTHTMEGLRGKLVELVDEHIGR